MGIEAIKPEVLVAVAADAGCDLNKLIVSTGNTKAERMAELKKLMPALNAGKINQSALLTYGRSLKAEKESVSVISAPTLSEWVKRLNTGKSLPEFKPSATASGILTDEQQRLINLGRTYEEQRNDGRMLVDEPDYLVLRYLKECEPALYRKYLERGIVLEENRINDQVQQEAEKERQRLLERQAREQQELNERLEAGRVARIKAIKAKAAATR